MRYVGCYILYLGSYSLYACCAGAMWAVASSMWALAGEDREPRLRIQTKNDKDGEKEREKVYPV